MFATGRSSEPYSRLFDHLELRDLVALSGTDRRFHLLTQDPALWKIYADHLCVDYDDSKAIKALIFRRLRVLRSQARALKTRPLPLPLHSALGRLEQKIIPSHQELIALYYESLKFMVDRLPADQVDAGVKSLPLVSLKEWLEKRDGCVVDKRIARSPPDHLELNDLCLSSLPNLEERVHKLSTLHLNFNQLRELPPSLLKLTGLTELSLHHNRLQFLSEKIEGLANLKILNLNHNLLQRVPESLARLSRLTELHISNNPLSRLPEQLGDLQELQTLSLSRMGALTLPDSLSKLTNLRVIHLSYTPLTIFPKALESFASTTVYLDPSQRSLLSPSAQIQVILDPQDSRPHQRAVS